MGRPAHAKDVSDEIITEQTTQVTISLRHINMGRFSLIGRGWKLAQAKLGKHIQLSSVQIKEADGLLPSLVMVWEKMPG